MFRYFRTLFFLILFFLEDDFLYIGDIKNNYYYPVIVVTRQLLKNHVFEPFKSTHTVKVPATYASAFQETILFGYDNYILEEAIYKELDERLWHYGLTVKHLRFNNGIISSFTYTYF